MMNEDKYKYSDSDDMQSWFSSFLHFKNSDFDFLNFSYDDDTDVSAAGQMAQADYDTLQNNRLSIIIDNMKGR